MSTLPPDDNIPLAEGGATPPPPDTTPVPPDDQPPTTPLEPASPTIPVPATDHSTEARPAAQAVPMAPPATAVAPPASPATAVGSNRPGTIGLILAGIGFLIALIAPVAILAWLFTLPAFVLSLVALLRKNRKKLLALIGLILSSVAFILSIVTFGVYSARNTANISGEPIPASVSPSKAPSAEPTPTPTSTPSATPAPKPPKPADEFAAYKRLNARQFKLLVKDPDATVGKRYIIYGQVSQFDAATGTCNFLADTSYKRQSDTYLYSENAIFTSGDGEENCPLLKNTVEDDEVSMWVVSAGSYSYDTQIGGNTTVPSFEIMRIKRY